MDMEENGVEVSANGKDFCFMPSCLCFRGDGKMNGILTGRRGPSCPSCICGKEVWNDTEKREEEEFIVSFVIVSLLNVF